MTLIDHLALFPSLFLLFLLQLQQVQCTPYPFDLAATAAAPLQTPRPRHNSSYAPAELKRQITTELSTCGFLDGDPDQARTADPGFNCRIDTQNGIWGFCPTTVIRASDCGLAGNCVDKGSCSSGCGITGTPGITTFTCNKPGEEFCSTARLTFGVDQTYNYIACGPTHTIQNYLASPTGEISLLTSIAKASSSKSSTSTPATSPSSTDGTESETSTSTPDPEAAETESPEGAETTGSTSNDSTGDTPGSTGTSRDNTGAIIGGVIGGVTVVGILVLGGIYLVRRDHKKNPGDSSRKRASRFFGRGGRNGNANGGDVIVGVDGRYDTPAPAWSPPAAGTESLYYKTPVGSMGPVELPGQAAVELPVNSPVPYR